MNSPESPLLFSLHRSILALEPGHAAFRSYASHYLADLLEYSAEDSQEPSAGQDAKVLVRLHWDAVPPSGWSDEQVKRWGRRLFWRDGKILFSEFLALPGLQVSAGWVEGRLELDGYYRPSSRRVRLAQRMGRMSERLYGALLYYLVYFPLLHYLEQTRGCRLLHAAAISRPEGDLLLAGLPGSGKSTFALAWLEDARNQLLSDNLLLFDENFVYACPEAIHLSPASLRMLHPAVEDRLMSTGRDSTYQRAEYRLLSEARAWQARPNLLVLLGQSRQLELQPISRTEALSRLEAFDLMSKEFTAYTEFAAGLRLTAAQADFSTNRTSRLEALIAQSETYQLWLEKDGDLYEAMDLVAATGELVEQPDEPGSFQGITNSGGVV
jgi:hypothetical protein